LLIRTIRRPRWRKWLVVFDVCLLTVIIDLASPALSPGVKLLMEEFHVGQIPATLATSVYILGLGIGPLVLSPLSEIPGIGRNKPYIVTLFLFTILQIPTALVSNYPGLLVLRFM
jgi:DHA1 family multidrug resistance protein-like MFS transporter